MDFTKYSLQELYEIEETIDRRKFPDRYASVIALIEERESSDNVSEEDKVVREEAQGMNSEEGCKKAMDAGFYTSIFCLLLHVSLSSYNLLKNSTLHNDWIWLAAELGVMVLLVYFIGRRSRVAICLMLAMVVGNLLLHWAVTGRFGGLLYVIIVALLFVAARATFHWHAIYNKPRLEQVSSSID